MRVLHFYKNALPFSMGGVEQVIDQIARSTQALGVENKVLTLSKTTLTNHNPIELNGYKVYSAKCDLEIASNGFSRESIHLFKRLALESDLIHYHFPWPFADLVHFIAAPKKPTVLTYHSDIIRQKLLLNLYRPLKIKFLKSIDQIVATSPNYLNTSKLLNNFEHKTTVIPIGLEESTYLHSDQDSIRYFHQCFGNRFFLFIGAFRYYKGLEYLLEAAKKTSASIVIVGAGSIEGELWANTYNHQLKNIYFLGKVSDPLKNSLLQACYGIIFPSNLRSEAFGVTLLEGAMFGKPLISCEIGTGTSYINNHLKTGLIVPPSNSQALADAMTWLLMHPDEARKMGEAARAHYQLLFTASRMAKSYCDLYHKILSR
jgi:rhamnosyl/mannosyltransferase